MASCILELLIKVGHFVKIAGELVQVEIGVDIADLRAQILEEAAYLIGMQDQVAAVLHAIDGDKTGNARCQQEDPARISEPRRTAGVPRELDSERWGAPTTGIVSFQKGKGISMRAALHI